MGLDMYINKTARMENIDYETLEDIDIENCESVQEFCQKANLPQEMWPYVKEYDFLPGYYRVFEKVGYWRKFNALHRWFVENIQGGVDECQLSEISKENLEKLLNILKKVRDDKDTTLLPTQSGFFFGPTSYDDYYWEDVADAIDQITQILSTTDFEKEILFYQSSW